MPHAGGRAGIHLNSIISSWNSETDKWDPEIRVDLYMDGPNAKPEFAALEKQKENIESRMPIRPLSLTI